MNATIAESALKALVSTINNTGGINYFRGRCYGCAADLDWLDLAEAYEIACKALGEEPKIQQLTDEEEQL